MNIEISNKIFRTFKELEECEGLTESEAKDYFNELVEEIVEDFIVDKLNKEQGLYDDDGGNEDE